MGAGPFVVGDASFVGPGRRPDRHRVRVSVVFTALFLNDTVTVAPFLRIALASALTTALAFGLATIR